MMVVQKENTPIKTLVIKAKLAHKKRVYRTIEISASENLHELAEAILDSFDFIMDHCFGFYSNLKKEYESDESYELFVDLRGANENRLGLLPKSVKKTKIEKVFSPNKKMLFLFDYGDGWKFELECIQESTFTGKSQELPRVLKVAGDSPGQYTN